MILKRPALLFCLFAIAISADSQQTSTVATQNPIAVTLATKSVAALSGSVQISDITLTGTATRTAGSDVENGTFTLKALGSLESRLDLVLSGSTRSEVLSTSTATSPGFWTLNNGTPNPVAYHNTLAGVVWFFPTFSALAQTSNPYCSVSYVGLETRQGTAVQHLYIAFQNPTASASENQQLAQLSGTDVYLDSSSNLPLALVFSTHPDNNALFNISAEVDFSNYEATKGVLIPFHIQKFLNGTLLLDLEVQTATLNSGLTDSSFSSN
jgi:hypothetical protein